MNAGTNYGALWCFPMSGSPDRQHQHHLRISLEVQMVRSHPHLLKQKLWEWRPAVCVSEPSRGFWCTLRLDNNLKGRVLLLNSEPSSGTASLKDLRHALLLWTSVCSSAKGKPWTRQHVKVLPLCSYTTSVILSGFSLLEFSHTGTEWKTATTWGCSFLFVLTVLWQLNEDVYSTHCCPMIAANSYRVLFMCWALF